MEAAAPTELDQVTWDLSHLLEGVGDLKLGGDPEAAVNVLLNRADELAGAFAEQHEGKVGELDGTGLIEAMQELARISDLVGRAGSYAHLRFAADTESPQN